MKKIFTFATPLFITLLFTLNVYAQQNNGNQGNVDVDTQELAVRQTELMEDYLIEIKLDLTAEQLKDVYDLNLDFADQLKDIHEAIAEDKTNGRGQLVSMRNKKDVELKKILTAEQWAAWEEWRTATKEDGSSRKGI